MSKKSINWFVFTVICLSSKQIVHTTNKQNKRLNIEYDTTEKIPAKKDKNNNNNCAHKLVLFTEHSSTDIFSNSDHYNVVLPDEYKATLFYLMSCMHTVYKIFIHNNL
jgi:hypothetical protein